jgi:hypothetical protein
MIKTIFFLVVVMTSVLLIFCSKDDSPLTTQVGNSSISGLVRFLDNSPASFAKVEIRGTNASRTFYDTCDINGNYSFTSLFKGDYTITFRSTSYDISTTSAALHLNENENLTQNLFVKYNMLDDFATKIISQDVFFIKMHPDGAKIGGNYSLIKNLSGYYNVSGIDSITLSADVYLVPANINWSNPGVDINSEYIRSNFQYLFSVDEDSVFNGRHEIDFFGNTIENIFSNPSNGFAFVRSDTLSNEIKIPCVDFNNNDFGLRIFYN